MTPEELEAARGELRDIAAGLRALLEWHGFAGTELVPIGTSDRPADSRAAGTADGPRGEPSASHDPEVAPTTLASAPQSLTAPTRAEPPRFELQKAPAAPAPLRIEPAPELSVEERVKRLDVLRERVVGCTACVLHEKRTQTVFARGNPLADLCFVGEGPGEEEDATGLPFVGRAGQLLDKMIAGMGLTPDEIYICNIVKCRPPLNRNPLPAEMMACTPFITEQLELAKPKVIVTLGNIPLKGLCGVEGITKLRGTWRLYKGHIPVMPTYHPSYVLRNPTPQVKREVWSDLREVLKQLGRQVPARRGE
ncbi:MAG: uracil-DNA glycosylase family protein [Polyangiaceae bacterium]